jgi:hypothetical protein
MTAKGSQLHEMIITTKRKADCKYSARETQSDVREIQDNKHTHKIKAQETL